MGLQFFRCDRFLSFLGIRRIIPCLIPSVPGVLFLWKLLRAFLHSFSVNKPSHDSF